MKRIGLMYLIRRLTHDGLPPLPTANELLQLLLLVAFVVPVGICVCLIKDVIEKRSSRSSQSRFATGLRSGGMVPSIDWYVDEQGIARKSL